MTEREELEGKVKRLVEYWGREHYIELQAFHVKRMAEKFTENPTAASFVKLEEGLLMYQHAVKNLGGQQ